MKTELRKNAKNKRCSLNMPAISSELIDNIRASAIYKEANGVMLFYPLKYEVNLLELLKDDKNFYLPRVNGEELEICHFALGDKLKKSPFNVYEPVCEPIKSGFPDLIFVPALVADTFFNRIGYGGGFYDRFIKDVRQKNRKTKFVIVIPEELVIEKVPVAENDEVCDGIITQKKSLF